MPASSVGWITRPSRSPPASSLRARVDRLASQCLDPLGVAGVDHRADVGRLVERVADRTSSRSACEIFLEALATPRGT